jgi:CubicO group peptidase (beta-lactamase class C family)
LQNPIGVTQDSLPAGVPESAPAHRELLELTRPDILRLRLEQAFPDTGLTGIHVGFAYDGAWSHVAIDGSGHPSMPAHVRPPGCLTKLFTATIARAAIAADRFALEDDAAQLLGRQRAAAAIEALTGVSVKHLFEHTHGLDDAGIASAPLRSDGCIDSAALCERLGGTARLAPPGRLYSYSNAGAWLLAAILEQSLGARFETLLRRELFDPLSVDVWPPESAPPAPDRSICAAIGGSLGIHVDGIAAFLSAVLPGGRYSCFGPEGDRDGAIVPLPGWHSLEAGIRLGWKHYGAGWFGHTSEQANAPALVRVHPRWRVGIVVVAEGRAPMSVAAAVFGKLLPNLVGLRMPKLLRRSELEALDVRRYAHRYENAAFAVSVRPGENAPLEIVAHRRRDGSLEAQPFFAAILHAAERNIFFPIPAEPAHFPFVQFVEPAADHFGFLWNGKNLLPSKIERGP